MHGPQFLFALEMVSVVLNVAYTLCIAYQKRVGWLFGFVASVIAVGLYVLAQTWAMSVLNAYYVGMAVYGWWSWGRVGEKERVRDQGLLFHAVAVPSGLLLSYLTASVLGQYLNGNFPRLDAFVTVFSFLATWLMARKYISNWLYFILADSVGIWLNWRIGYKAYAALFAMYLALSVLGLVKWRRQLRAQQALNA